MNALEMLREDHDAVIGMLDKLRDGAGGAEGSLTERKRLATALVIAESRHEAAAERVVRPVVRRMVEGGDALADAAIKQESDGKALLRDIDAGDAGSEAVSTCEAGRRDARAWWRVVKEQHDDRRACPPYDPLSRTHFRDGGGAGRRDAGLRGQRTA